MTKQTHEFPPTHSLLELSCRVGVFCQMFSSHQKARLPIPRRYE
jgi:hypothetical protein